MGRSFFDFKHTVQDKILDKVIEAGKGLKINVSVLSPAVVVVVVIVWVVIVTVVVAGFCDCVNTKRKLL